MTDTPHTGTASSEPQKAVDPATIQDVPAMDMHTATETEKLDGLVEQTRVDVGDKSLERIAEVLRQRCEQSGITVDDSVIESLAQRAKI